MALEELLIQAGLSGGLTISALWVAVRKIQASQEGMGRQLHYLASKVKAVDIVEFIEVGK